MKPIMTLPTRLLAALLVWGAIGSLPQRAEAQLIISETISVQQNVPDMGDLVNQYVWSTSTFTVIDSVKVNLVFSSPVSTDPMWLGQLVVTLTHGLPSEPFRSEIVLNRRGVTASDSFGDPASFLNEEFDLGGSVFAGSWLPSNSWTLTVSDMQAGGIAKLENYTLTVTGIPEPGSMALAALGVAWVLSRVRRRARLP